MGQEARVQASESASASWLDSLNDIPTLPAVASRVNQLINDPKSSSLDIAEVLKKDQVLTAKLLRLVNSSYYSIPGGVSDVKRALSFLGFNTVAQLILGVSVFSLFREVDTEDFSMAQFWKHALATGICAELISKRYKVNKPEEAFTCGLLHDIGKLVLHEVSSQRFSQIVALAKKGECSFHDIEIRESHEIPGHTRLGELMAEKWGLPTLIRDAIKFHHQSSPQASDASKMILATLRLGDAIVLKRKIGNSGDFAKIKIDASLFASLGSSVDDLPAVEKEFDYQIEKASALMNGYP